MLQSPSSWREPKCGFARAASAMLEAPALTTPPVAPAAAFKTFGMRLMGNLREEADGSWWWHVNTYDSYFFDAKSWAKLPREYFFSLLSHFNHLFVRVFLLKLKLSKEQVMVELVETMEPWWAMYVKSKLQVIEQVSVSIWAKSSRVLCSNFWVRIPNPWPTESATRVPQVFDPLKSWISSRTGCLMGKPLSKAFSNDPGETNLTAQQILTTKMHQKFAKRGGN